MSRVLVTGDRNWTPHDLALAVVQRLSDKYGLWLTIVHGSGRGIDRTFQNACHRLRVKEEPHPADWDGLGKQAGPTRNSEMVNAGADLCIAVHRDIAHSRGTYDCVTKALAAGIPVYLVDSEETDEHGRHRLRRITSL